MIKGLTTGSVVVGLVSYLMLAAVPLPAMTVRPMDLHALTRAAAMIVAGKVTHVESRPDEHGLPATFITIAVMENIKGAKEEALTIKQFGFQELQADGGAFKLAGMPSYQRGEELILFLHRPSDLGFTSPVGLEQGKYTVMEAAPGKRMVQNQVGNRNLFRTGQYGASYTEAELKLRSMKGRLLDYEGFLSVIKRAVGGQPE